jgi:hypothetical protein
MSTVSCSKSSYGKRFCAIASLSKTWANKAADPANVAAGKTPVGAKIKARLAVATLIDGKVIPRSAVFSGEVIDSAAKTADASRLAIRMDSMVWKKG